MIEILQNPSPEDEVRQKDKDKYTVKKVWKNKHCGILHTNNSEEFDIELTLDFTTIENLDFLSQVGVEG